MAPGRASGRVGFQGGKIRVERPRVRDKATGSEIPLPGREEVRDGGFLEQWATSPMLVNGQARKLRPAVRLKEAAIPGDMAPAGHARRSPGGIEAPAGERLRQWMSSDTPEAGLPVMQAGGMHLATDLLTAPAIGAGPGGHEHPPAVVEGATGRPATVQALLDNLIERGLDPSMRRLFVLDGARAPASAVRRTFGAGTSSSACPGICMPAGPGVGFAGLPAASNGRLLVSPDRFPRPRRDPHGGPARIAEGARTGPGHDRHDRERPFGARADLPGHRAMAWSRDGAAGPAPACRRPGPECGAPGPAGSCRSWGPHRRGITGEMRKPPASTTAHGRHDDQPAALAEPVSTSVGTFPNCLLGVPQTPLAVRTDAPLTSSASQVTCP